MEIDEYAYIGEMRNHFSASVRGVKNLFEVDVDKEQLWQAYLNGFPESERQHYNCNTCKNFIRNYGRVVIIDERGQIKSPLWSAVIDGEHQKAFDNLNDFVRQGAVKGVFYSSDPSWGIAKNLDERTGIVWEHLSVTPPPALVYRSRTKTAAQAMAEKREEYLGLRRALADFSKETVERALALATSGTLRRGDLVKAPLEWFLNVVESVKFSQENRLNNRWRAVATAPAGFCFIRSGLAGTLMSDIQEGYSAADIKRRYEDKADPSQYQRSQVAPSVGNIAHAEKVIADLGLTSALERRYASVDEVHMFWRSQKLAAEQKVQKGAVFGHLKPKAKSATEDGLDLPQTTMTWVKFSSTVLPTATAIEVLVPESSQRFAGLVTAADPEAAPILKWDYPARRNPFSWYYADGVDASIKRKVAAAGGQVEDVDIRLSLAWHTYTDLDLHCQGPNGLIYYRSKSDGRGGRLDVDMNISPETLEPVENIRWPKGRAPNGNYEVHVHNFTNRSSSNEFQVEMELFGKVYMIEGNSRPSTGSGRLTVATFSVLNGEVHSLRTMGPVKEAIPQASAWGLAPRTWVPVHGLCQSPNLWNAVPAELASINKHVFFLLEGCRDNNEGVGRGFFSEFLINDLKPIRSTLEAYSAQAMLLPAPDDNPACGLGMSDNSPWNLTVRVQTTTGSRTVLIDRWD